MSRTGLFDQLRRIIAAAAVSKRTGLSPREVLARRRGPSRRDVLRASAAGAALLPLAACGDDVRGNDLEVAIVGGGIAGLHCAYRLAEANIESVVFEASARTGGRMFTSRGAFPDNQICELGGELVDTAHVTMMSLATDFGLTLDELATFTPGLAENIFYFDGGSLDPAAISAEFGPVATAMANAVTAAEADDAEFLRIDNMSIPEWLEGEAGLAPDAQIARILEITYTGEYGLESDVQSVFNLLYLIDYDTPDPFHIFGDSDERFHIHEGNDAVPDALARELGDGRIRTEHVLTKVEVRDDGRYLLHFDTGDGDVPVVATHVVFALPFTRLRQVDLTGAGISADKLNIINTLGMGTNAKLMMGFDTRAWYDTGWAGGSYTDVGQLQSTWESTRGQGGDRGILTNFVGGQRGLDMGNGTAEDRANEVMPWVDTLFPGSAAAYTANSALRMHWPTQPNQLGSYACYTVGQWEFFGMEGQREGNLHFCGEHTSQDFQGYMEGGAETGAFVAMEIMDDMGAKPSPRLVQIMAPKLRRPQATYHAGRFRGERTRLRRNQRRRLG